MTRVSHEAHLLIIPSIHRSLGRSHMLRIAFSEFTTALLFVRDAAALVLEAVSIHEEDILLAAFCFVMQQQSLVLEAVSIHEEDILLAAFCFVSIHEEDILLAAFCFV
ncbi:hypothetical protein ACJX0J_026979, partial [Zea mays]